MGETCNMHVEILGILGSENIERPLGKLKRNWDNRETRFEDALLD
jgi:hypothetical protein